MNDKARISHFGNCFDTTPVGDIPLYNFYSAVKSGIYAQEVEKIRSCHDPDEKKKLKKSLPCFTISGIFSMRNAQSLKQHSGRLCLDIDAKHNPQISDWKELRTTLGTWESVEFSSLSVSGKGVFVVTVILYPEKHQLHFLALEKVFSKYGLVIDPICKDICRLRIVSSDRDAVLNNEVVPFRLLYKVTKQLRRVQTVYNDTLQKAIDEIVKSGVDITESYKNWYEIGCALVNESGESGRDDFHRLSQFYPGYNQKECDKQYNACKRNPKEYTGATIYYYAKQHGIFSHQY
jgi:hypothetical protein